MQAIGQVVAWRPDSMAGPAGYWQVPIDPVAIPKTRPGVSDGAPIVPRLGVIEKWRDYVSLLHSGVNKGKVFRWALALSDYDFTIEFISDESDNIADWLSRYAGDDEGDDALLDRISLKVAAVWAPRLLNLPALPTKEVFVKAYVQKGNPNLPGLHCNDRWWIRQRQKRSTSPASYAHGWPSYSTSVRTAAWELARRAGGPRTSKMIRERLICARLKTPPVHQQGLPSGGI
ncbi:hypothetical protein GNI_145970 [Gregarina niphandrodes]|uniref:Uncharacterized protein n=1 Tax=Gregarina niphandrodes TaxID=110365 RepID=A0A023AZU2_GRENI|nr:hypothetical protein GNI_145970 [Gregarina niphandrodes]EZG44569.1 hypothetical protein GNI_145970 [Gregarina niphandrodes]|eukprot:XP_011134155.1 hypothetical protein GNI_145970 [Gregarina niphandrodes]